MIFFPNCKINLGLNIIRRRPDGFHDLETVFYPLPLRDIIEAVPSDQFNFTGSGLPLPGNQENNLCIRAYRLLKKRFPSLPPVHFFLHKNIPAGAGLGGGSADAACTLRMLNQQFDLDLSGQELMQYARELGSDCPFFILNKPCFGSGRGDVLEPIELNLSKYVFVLVHPGIHMDTALAFSGLTPTLPARPIREILRAPLPAWRSALINDFEAPAIRKYPELVTIRDTLYASGAVYASMTGSGSSFYGIFEKQSIPSIRFEQNFRVDILK